MYSATRDGSGSHSSTIAVGLMMGLFALLAIIVAGNAADPGMHAQALTFLGLAICFILGVAGWGGKLGHRNPFDSSVYEDTIIKYGVFASSF